MKLAFHCQCLLPFSYPFYRHRSGSCIINSEIIQRWGTFLPKNPDNRKGVRYADGYVDFEINDQGNDARSSYQRQSIQDLENLLNGDLPDTADCRFMKYTHPSNNSRKRRHCRVPTYTLVYLTYLKSAVCLPNTNSYLICQSLQAKNGLRIQSLSACHKRII